MKKVILFALSIVLLGCTALAKNDDGWKEALQKMLTEFLSCGGPTAANSPCNEFVGKALGRVYGISDFEKTQGHYMLATEIATYVSVDSKWTFLGDGNSQQGLDEAQASANNGKAVVAVYGPDTGMGHVALVLPGTETKSGKWGLNCPNSASFFIGKPAEAYVGKPLSFAFGALLQKDVKLYGRN